MAEALESTYPWRTGRSVGRTIYACPPGSSYRNGEILIGMMDSEDLATRVVEVHNWWVEVHKEADEKWKEWLDEQLPHNAQDDGDVCA